MPKVREAAADAERDRRIVVGRGACRRVDRGTRVVARLDSVRRIDLHDLRPHRRARAAIRVDGDDASHERRPVRRVPSCDEAVRQARRVRADGP